MTTKEKVKTYGVVIIVVVLLSLSGLMTLKINSLKKSNELKAIELSTLNDSVKIVVGKHGEVTGKLKAVEIEAASTRKALETAGFEIKDLKDRNISWRKTVAALKVDLKAANEGKIILRDTTYVPVPGEPPVNGLTGEWNDGYLFLKPLIVHKELDFKYTYQTGINFLLTKEKKTIVVNLWLTDPKDPEIQNPYGQITKGNAIFIPEESHWYLKPWIWGLAGLTGGYFLSK